MSDSENITIANANTENLSVENISDITSIDGKIQISVSIGNKFQISCPGFMSQIITVENNNNLKIQLKVAVKSDSPIRVEKPVTYLYPKTRTEVTISVKFKRKMITTFPKLIAEWDLTAYPDGKIFGKGSNRFYNSLFWDGTLLLPQEHYSFKNGLIELKENLSFFLVGKLKLLGLNQFETHDFIEFWLLLLEQNERNCIRFLTNSDYSVISENIVDPAPDNKIRVFMEFYNAGKNTKIEPQIFNKVDRKVLF